MGNTPCALRNSDNSNQINEIRDVTEDCSFKSLQNLQNDEAPVWALRSKLNESFTHTIIASKNIMNCTSTNQTLSSTHQEYVSQSTGGKENQNFNLISPQMSAQLEEMLFIPVCSFIKKMKVKKPQFTMIQIDPKNFIVMKEKPIKEDYEIQNQIGKGGFGSVYKAREKNIGEMRAVKKISKNQMNNEEKLSLINQFQILRRLDHPNIIKLYDIYEDDEFLYVVTELCEGGNLLQFTNKNPMTERIIRQIMTQVLSAVKYMHSFNILHRDLKLQNIVVVKKTQQFNKQKIQIKLIDFGISVDLNKDKIDPNDDLLGTLIYMSPEVFDGNVGLALDMWSCGIIFYMMSTKKMPYTYKSEEQLVHKITKDDIIRKNLQKISLQLKVFIMSFLQKDPKSRITADKSLKNVWICKQKRGSKMTQSKRAQAVNDLLSYDAKNNLVSMIESYLVCKKINQSERQRLARIFQEFDQDKSGIIQVQQFKKFYAQNSDHYDVKEVEQLLKIIDKNKSGKIDFNEFISAMYSRRKLFQIKALEQAFDFFDKDKSGQLSKNEVRIILQGIQNQQIEYLFKQLDSNKDMRISKKQFITYLINHQENVQ